MAASEPHRHRTVRFVGGRPDPDRVAGAHPGFAGLGLLVLVLFFGDEGKGAQRWLDLRIIRFQPSEIMKLAVPMFVAWLCAGRPLPVGLGRATAAALFILIPVALIEQQPDLGTALLVGTAGLFALFLAGLRWRIMIGLGALATALTPLFWHSLQEYQRQRVRTFLNPEADPLGAGYHIIQSKIAIGSGGLFGKGWLNGTQSQLEFLPERSTDFIFAVFAEEFGLFGALALLTVYLFIIGRGIWIAANAQDTFGRLLAGSITLTFFVYVFVNTGMVTGLLPVVGVPLPLFSYGGTAVVTLFFRYPDVHTHAPEADLILMHRIPGIATILFLAACAAPGVADDDLRDDHAAFIESMVERHGFDRAELTALFEGMRTRQDIIDAMTRPAEAFPWHRYRPIFMTDARIAGGVRFWGEHAATIARAAETYGVDPEVIVAIIGVESNYGHIQGRYPVIEAVATLAFDHPPRADFFRRELEEFLLLTREESIDPATAKGSYAGAMGSPQFISSSYRAYAVDFDDSGSRDLWTSWPDIIGSIANYFHVHGWRAGDPVAVPATLRMTSAAALATRKLDMQHTVGGLRAAGVEVGVELDDRRKANLLELETDTEGAVEHWVTLHNFFVITRYNRSPLYAMAVHQLAEAIKGQMGSDP